MLEQTYVSSMDIHPQLFEFDKLICKQRRRERTRRINPSNFNPSISLSKGNDIVFNWSLIKHLCYAFLVPELFPLSRFSNSLAILESRPPFNSKNPYSRLSFCLLFCSYNGGYFDDTVFPTQSSYSIPNCNDKVMLLDDPTDPIYQLESTMCPSIE